MCKTRSVVSLQMLARSSGVEIFTLRYSKFDSELQIVFKSDVSIVFISYENSFRRNKVPIKQNVLRLQLDLPSSQFTNYLLDSKM
jgi:hypothetical protein